MTTSPSSREFVQGSREWLSWRREGIGASESAALLGHDPYGKTPRTLWRDKLAPEKPAGTNEEATHLVQGHEVETMLRAMHEIETGEDWPAACFEHPEYPFIRASLDGWNGKRAIECKSVAPDAMGQPIPTHHVIQCQHQLLVTATDVLTYIRHCRATGQTEKLEVATDLTIQRDILAACWKFWDQVQRKAQPEATDADWIERTDLPLALVARDWKNAKVTSEKKSARALMLQMVDAPRTLCEGVKIQCAPFQERVWEVK